MLLEMYPNDKTKVEKILGVLKSNPDYGKKLAKLKKSTLATKAFLGSLVQGEPLENTDTGRLDEQVQSMRMEYQQHVGTEIVEFEESWVLIPDLPPDARKLSQCLGASAFFTGHQFAQQAVAATGFAQQATASAAPAEIARHLGVAAASITRQAAAAGGSTGSLTLQSKPLIADSTWLMRGGGVLTVGVLGYEFYGYVRMYWKRQIDGYELAEKLIAGLVSAAAAALGALGGASVMAGAGPGGVAFGAFVGALLASEITRQATHEVVVKLCGHSRERALRDAYAALELHPRASAHQVRQQYVKLAKESHPDVSPACRDRYVRVNCAYELIRASILAA